VIFRNSALADSCKIVTPSLSYANVCDQTLPMSREQDWQILFVEDNPADVRLFQQALRITGARHQVTVVDNGEDAADLLFKRGQYTGAGRPDLILLDLNLPKKNGLELLREVKLNSSLKQIPVIILTSSDSHSDINKAYESGANMYLLKPSNLDEVERLMDIVSTAWLQTAMLPSRSRKATH